MTSGVLGSSLTAAAGWPWGSWADAGRARGRGRCGTCQPARLLADERRVPDSGLGRPRMWHLPPDVLPRASGPQTLPRPPAHCRLCLGLCLDRPPLVARFALREDAMNTARPSAGHGLRCALGPHPLPPEGTLFLGATDGPKPPGPRGGCGVAPSGPSAWCAQGAGTEGVHICTEEGWPRTRPRGGEAEAPPARCPLRLHEGGQRVPTGLSPCRRVCSRGHQSAECRFAKEKEAADVGENHQMCRP